MNVIYADKKIDGLDGVYASPSLFKGDCENCSVVYTDDADIKKAYEAKGIEVNPISKPKEVRVKSKKD